MNPRNGTAAHTLISLALSLGAFGGMPGFPRYSPSAASIRHDPKRPKTPEDLDRMEAAEAKRRRKAEKREIAARKKSGKFLYAGNFSAVDPAYSRSMYCDDCMVSWTGCWDNFTCPRCGEGELPTHEPKS